MPPDFKPITYFGGI